jgi:Sec-independent protein translocase protein TatA
MDQIMAFLKEMREEINQQLNEMRKQMDQQYYDLRKEIKITQQAVLDTSDELKAETVQLKESIQELQQRLNLHRQKFTFLEEELHLLKEKQ